MQFIRYDLDYNPNPLHPQEAIKELGFKVIHGVPQSIYSCWWFCVEDYDFNIEERAKTDYRYKYVSVMLPYSLKYWRDHCFNNCEYFEKSFNVQTQTHNWEWCCYGGERCFKEGDKNGTKFNTDN